MKPLAKHINTLMLYLAMSEECFRFTNRNDDLHITLATSQFDAQVAEQFNEAVQLRWADNIQSVSIDMQAVEFIDSSGVGALLALRKRLPQEAPAVSLVGTQPGVTSVLEMLRLHRVFRLEAA